MIRFTDAPIEPLGAPKLIRVKPGEPARVILLNRKYIGLNTHYWGGHTVSCEMSKDCRACQTGLLPVWQGFIFVTGWRTKQIALLTFTPVVAANLLNSVEDQRGLLGMKVSLRRKTKAPNSGLLTEFHGFDNEVEEQHAERLANRVRIIFKDHMNSPQRIQPRG